MKILAEELLDDNILTLSSDDGIKEIKEIIQFVRYNELPVVDKGEFKGYITKTMLMKEQNLKKKIGAYSLQNKSSVVSKSSDIFEVLKITFNTDLTIVVVISEDKKYCGVVSVQEVIEMYSQSVLVQLPGSLLTISLPLIDYSLTEISRLIEENNAKILSCTLSNHHENSSMVKLTIKINQADLTPIIATLERFGYHITSHHPLQRKDDQQKEKIDMLIKLFDI